MSPDFLARPGTMGRERPSHQEPESVKGAPSDSPLVPARFSLLLLRDPCLPQTLTSCTPYNSALSPALHTSAAYTWPALNSLPSNPSLVILECPLFPGSRAFLHSPIWPPPHKLHRTFLPLPTQSPQVAPPSFPHHLCLTQTPPHLLNRPLYSFSSSIPAT